MIFSNRLRQLRKEKGLTQQELGDLINVTKVSICCYEKGTRTPTLETLMELTKVFNVDLNYFLGYDTFIVSENEENYGILVAKEEIGADEFMGKLENYIETKFKRVKRY